MSINALLLDGWDETSTWGIDNGTFYAQLNANGRADEDSPQIWIAPPRYVVANALDLARVIASVTSSQPDDVMLAMRRGLVPSHPALDFDAL